MRLTLQAAATFLFFSLLFVAAREAGSLPRYSARYGQKCLLCHQNPTGGGMRSLYASQFLTPNEIAARPLDEESLSLLDPKLSRSVSFGADLRTLATWGEKNKEENNFLQMQGDIYLHVQLDKRFAAYLDRGIDKSYELFGMGFILPAGGYVKAGRFTPAYGWRFSDHKMFTRRELGYFDPPRHSDVGVEVGFFPGDFSVNAAVLNGAPGSTRDTDGVRAYAFRAEHRRRVGRFNLAAGASYMFEDESVAIPWAAGPFAYASLGPYTWVGEWDWNKTGRGDEPTALVTSHELTRQIVKGVDLRATYDFHDPDTARKSGSRSRFGVGLDTLPYPYLGLLGMVHWYGFDEGLDVTGEDHVRTDLVLHFLY